MSASVLSAAPAGAVHGAVPGDFNGDGYRDVVMPAPGANVSGKAGAGAVVVLYGSKSGVSTASKRQTITQNSSAVPGSAEAGDAFGTATATADLNHDGYADLLVGSPGEDTTRGTDAGSVTVLWGSKSGLTTATMLDKPTGLDGSVNQDHYGLDIAALSLGTGAKTRVTVAGNEGTLFVSGPFSHTGTHGAVGYENNTASVVGVALGDFNQDGVPDPVIDTDRLSGLSGGEVYLNTGATYLLARGNGLVSATGDVNGDGYTDLVVADPDDPTTNGVDGAVGGRILLWYGSKTGIAAGATPVQLTQSTAGVPGTSAKNDGFGAALAVSDLDGDGAADIVVGTPQETSNSRAGVVTVIPGRRTGTLGTGSYSLTQDTAGVPGASETDDMFGTTVAIGDINGDGKPELLVSAGSENNSTGAVWVFPGTASGPTATGSRMFTAPSVGLTQTSRTALGGSGLLPLI
ncbi:FG-GAP-like repeat-containing protein [Streptomyces mangrovisoli]|uniref:FG-GAP-like repeat-containing protein n=1 Tax=Streptomyces mangrovisoli TaxID=1428628 RepID=UPI0030B85B43